MKSFERCHPVTNFVYYICAVIFGMIFLHPVFLCISFFSAFFYSLKLYGGKVFKSFFCFLLPVMTASAVINGLTAHYGVTPLFFMPNGNSVCLEPVIYGFVSGASASCVILIFFCYNKTVNSDKLYYVLSKSLPKTALLLTMSLRFAPMYSKKIREISEAQKGLGKGTDSGGLSERIKNGLRILSVLTSWALENSVETADSMKSRGYGLKNRSHYSDYRFSRTDAVMLSVMTVCCIVVIIGAAKGETYVLYNPFFEISKITPFSVFVMFNYVVFFVTPLISDLFGEYRVKNPKKGAIPAQRA